MRERRTRSRVVALGLVIALSAWFPAQGQYRRGRSGGSRGGGQHSSRADTPVDAPLANFAGAVTSLNAKHLSVQDANGKVLEFECSKKTTYWRGKDPIKASGVKPGAHVTVGAKIGIDGKAEAVEVHVEDGSSGTPPPAALLLLVLRGRCALRLG